MLSGVTVQLQQPGRAVLFSVPQLMVLPVIAGKRQVDGQLFWSWHRLAPPDIHISGSWPGVGSSSLEGERCLRTFYCYDDDV